MVLIVGGECFDVIFVVCDEIVFGVFGELWVCGCDVLGEIGVVGFDSIKVGEYLMFIFILIELDFCLVGIVLVDKLFYGIVGMFDVV